MLGLHIIHIWGEQKGNDTGSFIHYLNLDHVNCRSDENDGSGTFVSSAATGRRKENDSGPEGQHGGAGGDDLASAGTLKTALKEALPFP